MDADRAAPAHQIVHDRAVDHLETSAAGRIADDNLGDVVFAGVSKHLVSDLAPGDRDRRSASRSASRR